MLPENCGSWINGDYLECVSDRILQSPCFIHN